MYFIITLVLGNRLSPVAPHSPAFLVYFPKPLFPFERR